LEGIISEYGHPEQERVEGILKGLARTRKLAENYMRAIRGEEIIQDIRPISLNDVVNEALGAITDEKGSILNIPTTLELDEDLPKCLADNDRLHQVVINLLKNAAESCVGRAEENRRLHVESDMGIRIRSRREGDEVILEISDTGMGIRPENLNRIFEKWFSTKGDKGNGLGLFESTQIIEDYDGRLEAESEGQMRGATFRMRLPKAA
jgi:signal transduction histidine kinase